MFERIQKNSRALCHSLLDFIMPNLCMNCSCMIDRQASFCAECWKKIEFIAPPICACCGIQFSIPIDAGALCGSCASTKPNYDQARAAMVYDTGSKPTILRFKHGDRIEGTKKLAQFMIKADAVIVGESDLIIPVPLHRWRLLKRGYNQAALLAVAIGKITGKAVLVDGLIRAKATESQGSKKRQDRIKNVDGAFMFDAKQKTKVMGKTILLIDDVLTTGATVNECARILHKNGAGRINVLTLARVRGSGA